MLFGLKAAPTEGDCHLQVDLLDTHRTGPPTVRVEINGQAFERSLPAGAGDASINGEPDKGTRSQFDIAFPASVLRVGDNEIRITTVKGSWMLYDSMELVVPEGAALGDVQSRTLIEDARPMRALQERDGATFQPVSVTLRHFGEDTDAVVRLGDEPPVACDSKRRFAAGRVHGT